MGNPLTRHEMYPGVHFCDLYTPYVSKSEFLLCSHTEG